MDLILNEWEIVAVGNNHFEQVDASQVKSEPQAESSSFANNVIIKPEPVWSQDVTPVHQMDEPQPGPSGLSRAPKEVTVKVECKEEDTDDEDDTENEDGDSEDEDTEEDGTETEDEPMIDPRGMRSSSPEPTCAICLNLLSLGQFIGSPESCLEVHDFCLDCIEEWSAKVNTCPVDRKEFDYIWIKKSYEEEYTNKKQVDSRNSVFDHPDEDPLWNEEEATYCEVCNMSNREDRLLLCDGCDLGFHCECLTPRLDEIPYGEWFCPICRPIEAPRESTRTRRVLPRTIVTESVRMRVEFRRQNMIPADAILTAPMSARDQAISRAADIISSRVGAVKKTPAKKKTTTKRKSPTKKRKTGGKKRKGTGKGKGKKKSPKKKTKRSQNSSKPLSTPRYNIMRTLGMKEKRVNGGSGKVVVQNTPSTAPTIAESRYCAGISTVSLFGHEFGPQTMEDPRTMVLQDLDMDLDTFDVVPPTPADLLGNILKKQTVLKTPASGVTITRSGKLELIKQVVKPDSDSEIEELDQPMSPPREKKSPLIKVKTSSAIHSPLPSRSSDKSSAPKAASSHHKLPSSSSSSSTDKSVKRQREEEPDTKKDIKRVKMEKPIITSIAVESRTTKTGVNLDPAKPNVTTNRVKVLPSISITAQPHMILGSERPKGHSDVKKNHPVKEEQPARAMTTQEREKHRERKAQFIKEVEMEIFNIVKPYMKDGTINKDSYKTLLRIVVPKIVTTSKSFIVRPDKIKDIVVYKLTKFAQQNAEGKGDIVLLN